MKKSFESQSLPIELAGEQVLLHPGKVMFWPAQRMLLVADVHLGKEHAFGRHGIAVPGGISEATLQRLFKLVEDSQASTLLVLGDFMHAAPSPGESWLAILSGLLDKNPALSMQIVAGNHDKFSGRHLIDKRIHWYGHRLIHTPFVMQHEPAANADGYVLAGHLHPAWRISRSRKQGVRSPVFWCSENTCVFPAFGEFTGGKLIKPASSRDRIFMIGPDCVLDVSKNRPTLQTDR